MQTVDQLRIDTATLKEDITKLIKEYQDKYPNIVLTVESETTQIGIKSPSHYLISNNVKAKAALLP